MNFTSALLGVSALLLVVHSPGLAQCTDEDGDFFYYEAGCGTPQDCDDNDANVFPGAPALCDGLRNDCSDPPCDNGGPEDCDADGDGLTPCEGDCDDANAFVKPGAAQTCDGTNNDCNDPLWPSVPDAELDTDDDDFPSCTGGCGVRVTTHAGLRTAQAGQSAARSIVAALGGLVVAYSTVLEGGGSKRVRAIRLDRWGRRLGEPVEVAGLPSSGPYGNPILAKANAGFGIAWEALPFLSFQLLGDNLAPIGLPTFIDDECEEQADAALHGVVWNGFEFVLVWTKYCDGVWGIFFARVGSDGHQIGAPIMFVEAKALGAIVWNGGGYAFAWEANGSVFIQKLTLNGAPDGPPIPVGSAVNTIQRPSLVWTGSQYAVAWTDNPSADNEIYLARFNANGQHLGADTRVSHAIGDSHDPQLVWSGSDYRVAWSDSRDGASQIYFSRVAANGQVIEPDRRVSSAPAIAFAPTSIWSGLQTMMVYSATVPPEESFFNFDIFAARESCHDCDDNNAHVYPGANEVCDGVDNDCLDVSWPTPPPADRDADGDGAAECEGDCNDSSAAVHPGANEICDALDDDCNGQIDEDAAGVDSDGDSVRNACDNCRFAFNSSQLDSDGDAAGNACDNCALVSNLNQADLDSDTRGDVCDNCPADSNVFQDDYDDDRAGDACDNCVFDWNATQSDFDHDNQGDMCDVNDGLIYVFSTVNDYREWQKTENGYTTWRSYRGSLAALRATGQYTQAPGSNPLAARDCGLVDAYVFDPLMPSPGAVAFNLVTGVAGGIESSLGTNSAGAPRPNANPCP